jgi:uncharacterized protein (TIGR00369 family)
VPPRSVAAVTALENLQAIVAGDKPGPPVAQLLGMRLVEVEDGRAVFELETDDRFWNPMGTVHGGILCDLADAALGVCWASTLGEGETFTTVELKINFLRPIREGSLKAVGTVTKRGRHIGMTECEVIDEEGRLVAKASATVMTLRGALAEGR